MTVRNTEATAKQPAVEQPVAKPLDELPKKEREKITSELLRIHTLVSNVADAEAHKDKRSDKAERSNKIDAKPGKD
ncbi:MAG TPA: hypothetical protein V6D22_10615 [Candidatus Obscuribacterales bacterium]